MARNLSSYGLLDHQRRALHFLSLYLQRNGEWFRREARLLGKGGFEADEIADLATSEDVAHLASLRRDVERQLRQLILRLLLVATQGKQREVACRIATALSRGAEDYVGVGLREILDSLYFANLAAIVTAEWGIFGWVFGNEQARFDELALVANQLGRRLEAHSLDLTPDQLEAGRSALSWMADRIKQSDPGGTG